MTTTASWSFSTELQKPHHAKHAYVSRERMWAWVTVHRALPDRPWACRVWSVCSLCRFCGQIFYMRWGDRISEKVTPRTFISYTRLIDTPDRPVIPTESRPADNHMVWLCVVENKVVLERPGCDTRKSSVSMVTALEGGITESVIQNMNKSISRNFFIWCSIMEINSIQLYDSFVMVLLKSISLHLHYITI